MFGSIPCAFLSAPGSVRRLLQARVPVRGPLCVLSRSLWSLLQNQDPPVWHHCHYHCPSLINPLHADHLAQHSRKQCVCILMPSTRIPFWGPHTPVVVTLRLRMGRALAFDRSSCDLFCAASSPQVYRLNLEQVRTACCLLLTLGVISCMYGAFLLPVSARNGLTILVLEGLWLCLGMPLWRDGTRQGARFFCNVFLLSQRCSMGLGLWYVFLQGQFVVPLESKSPALNCIDQRYASDAKATPLQDSGASEARGVSVNAVTTHHKLPVQCPRCPAP